MAKISYEGPLPSQGIHAIFPAYELRFKAPATDSQLHRTSALQPYPSLRTSSQHASAQVSCSSAGTAHIHSSSGAAAFTSAAVLRPDAATSAGAAATDGDGPFSSAGTAEFVGGAGVAQFAARREIAEQTLAVGVAAVPLTLKERWKAWVAESYRLRSQLRAYGAAGLLAYGLLNTLYYATAFLVIWVYIAKVPRGLGWSEASRQFATVMSLTWAASQITKVPRAACALLIAPVADAVLLFLQARLRLGTRRNAFIFVVASCLGLSAALFGTVVWAWA